MKRSEADRAYKLIEEWTSAEIKARHGHSDGLEFVGFAQVKIEKEDELRKLIFGTSDLLELGKRWGILNLRQGERKRRKMKKKKRSKR